MKITCCLAILLSIAVTTPLTAQVKKPVARSAVKQAAKPVAKTILSRIDFFKKDADDAVEILADELKKIKIDLKDLDEEELYNFSSDNTKLPGDIQTEKTLEFSDNLIAYVKASSDNVVKQLTFSVTNPKHYAAIKSMLSIDKMTELNGGYNDTLLRSGEIFVNLSSIEDYDEDEEKDITTYSITAERIGYSQTVLPEAAQYFDINNIDIHTNYTDISNALLNVVKRLGYSFYYQAPASHMVDEIDKRTGSFYTAYFNKHISVNFTLNKLWMLSTISISTPDPIAFNRLKKAFDLSGWTKKQLGTGNEVNIYTNKNVECEVDGNYHTIRLSFSPSMSDINTRFALASAPGLSQIIALRKSGSADEIAQTLAKYYLTDIRYDETKKEYVYDESADDFQFFYQSPQGTTVRVYLKLDLTTEWTAPFIVYSDDKAYLQSLSDEFEKSTELKKKYTKSIKDGSFALYDISMEATREAKAEEQRRAEAAQQRAEEERVAAQKERARLAELERQRLQAEKDAKFTENMRKATEIMQKLLKN